MMIKEIYIIWGSGGGPSVVEAFSPGQAIEYFLASHGMMNYDNIRIMKADGISSIDEVQELVSQDLCGELDGHHKWVDNDFSG